MVATKDMIQYYPANEKPCENYESLVEACYDDFVKGEGNFDIPYLDKYGHLTVSKGIVLCYNYKNKDVAYDGGISRFETYGYTPEQQECLIKATKLMEPSEFMSMDGNEVKVFTKKDGNDTYEIKMEKIPSAGAKVLSVTKNGKEVVIPAITEDKDREAFRVIFHKSYYQDVARNVRDLHSLPRSVQCLLMHRAWGGNCSGTGNTLSGAVSACSEWIIRLENSGKLSEAHPLYKQMESAQKLCARIEGNKNIGCVINENENPYNIPVDKIIDHYAYVWKDVDVNVKNFMEERPEEFSQYVANFMAEGNMVDDLRYALYVNDEGELAHIPYIQEGYYNDDDGYINQGDVFSKKSARPIQSAEERNAILAYWKYMDLEGKEVDILKFSEFDKMYSEVVNANGDVYKIQGNVSDNCIKAYDYVLNNHERDRRYDYISIYPGLDPVKVPKLTGIPEPEASAHQLGGYDIVQSMKNQEHIHKMTENSKMAGYDGSDSGNPRMDELLPDNSENKKGISVNSVIIPYANDKEK